MYYICSVKKTKVTYRELRLGNIVHYKNHIKVHTLRVTCLDEKKIKLGGCLRRYDQVIPVSLTKDILADWCGFAYNDVKDIYNKNGLKLRLNTEKYIVEVHLCGKVREITSLHQLQNLYYAITGEEIEISEEKIDPCIETYSIVLRTTTLDEEMELTKRKLEEIKEMRRAKGLDA